MLLIRGVEDEVQRMFTQGLVRGTTHLCQGQEAVAVGVCATLKQGDSMTCTYRGHGAVLAMGAQADAVFGEIMGKAKGLCGGKGGSRWDSRSHPATSAMTASACASSATARPTSAPSTRH